MTRDHIMNVAVLGAGAGGCAVAFDWAMRGHRVTLFDFEAFPETIAQVQLDGGIHAEGALEGFGAIAYAGHNLAEATDAAEIIFVVGPAYSTRPFAEACRPYLRPGQIVLICPGSCAGSVEFKRRAGLGISDTSIHVAETSTLPYAVRLAGPARIRVFLKLADGLFMAAVPAANNVRVLESMQGIYPAMVPAQNVLHTSLQNGNPVIHPAVTMLNAALIERTRGDFYFYEDGVTSCVGRLILAIDQERIAMGRKLGLKVLAEPVLGHMQGYMAKANYDTGYSEAPGFQGIKAQSSLDHRYFNEDVGYGLVFLQSLGEQIGVETPSINAVLQIASVLMGKNYRGEARRTMQSLGLSGYSAEELRALLS